MKKKAIGFVIKKNTSRLIIKKGYSHIQEKIKEIRTKFLSGSNQWTT